MLQDLVDNLRSPEQACKEYFLRSDIDLTSIIIAAAAVLVPPMIYLEHTYYGFGSEFYVTASIEALFALFSVVVLFFIRRNRHVKSYERMVFAWSMVTTASSLFATFLQPARIIENFLINELLLIAIHLLLNNKLSFRLIPAATITVGCISALLATENAASVQQDYLLTLFLVVLNVVGIIVVARNNRFKKLEYESQNREREARKMFETLAATDPLTGILNHRSFLELTQLALDRFKKSQYSFCLAIFDLNHLKQINDTHGHLAGDKALKLFTTLVASKKRATDVFGRLGGDEFGFILPRVNRTDTLKIVSRLKDSLKALTIPSSEGDFHISFSAGVTEVRAEDISTDDLIHRADEALYLSKGKGDDRIEER
jgi:diguanylate cyclase (GGDEF)-like protein